MPRRFVASPAGELLSRLNRHFASYAIAMTGIVVFGLTNNSDAAIVYSGDTELTPVLTQSGGNPSGDLYINLETGVSDASPTLVPGWDVEFSVGGGKLIVASPSTAQSDLITNGSFYSGSLFAAKLDSGVSIDADSYFGSYFSATTLTLAMNYAGYYNTYKFGPWTGKVTDGFLGLSFTTADGLEHYAWVRLDVTDDSYVPTITGWAYESTPGVAILAGETPAAVPEPSSAAALGVLALGAVGIRSRRLRAV